MLSHGVILCLSAACAAILYGVFWAVFSRPVPLARHLARFALLAYMLALFALVLNPQPSVTPELRAAMTNFFPGFQLSTALHNRDSVMLLQIFLNILAFVPLGLLLPIVFPRPFRRLLPTALAGLLTTGLIESLQFLFPALGRIFDVDDILCNLVGCVLGYLLYIFAASLLAGRSWWQTICPYVPKKNTRIACGSLAALFVLSGALLYFWGYGADWDRLNVVNTRLYRPSSLVLAGPEPAEPPCYAYQGIDPAPDEQMAALKDTFSIAGETRRLEDGSLYAAGTDGDLTLNPADGSFTYSRGSFPRQAYAPLAPQSAMRQARLILQQYGLYQEGLQGEIAFPVSLSSGEAGEETLTVGQTVTFSFPPSYLSAEGEITVSYGQNGLVKIHSSIRRYEKQGELSLHPLADCLSSPASLQISSLDTNGLSHPDVIVIQEARLCYRRTVLGNRLPVWSCTGTAQKDGRETAAALEFPAFY
ncbi:VanZ family protein [Christensenellaceae bacterium NSJ-63]|uniref:VanZ family protein n=1 Tax=Guopingia tenuis TaxID=2763656 RepID=A0A926HW45_9FIRM|nr:VanZ family protein [Guopingia tenuis]MBC8538639.1 VanZ family protein [Guopingia tenuis]